ncbi:hypothetical protein R1sor_004146 [Riccia sorocarpa]|uniref:Uncharacterized protein n=1 Tax=Riccia sorocarpa TaxID=122646 RepID=A0ABD3H7J6_9MARC
MDARRASFELFGGSGDSQVGIGNSQPSYSPRGLIYPNMGFRLCLMSHCYPFVRPTLSVPAATTPAPVPSALMPSPVQAGSMSHPSTPEEVEDVEMENQGGNPDVTVRNRVVWTDWMVVALLECKRIEYDEAENATGREQIISSDLKWRRIQTMMREKGVNADTT